MKKLFFILSSAMNMIASFMNAFVSHEFDKATFFMVMAFMLWYWSDQE